MALSYEESAQLMTDPQFRGRVKVAALNYAYRILSGGASQFTASLVKWAQAVFQSADSIAQQVQPAAVMEPGVQSLGANIDDGGLQFAVENAVYKLV